MSVVDPLVIKIGGALLDSSAELDGLFQLVSKLQKQRAVVLVHGGGKLVDEWLHALGKTTTKINGLRVTPEDQIEYVSGALAGTANKKLVGIAAKYHFNAVGLSLADGDIAICQQLDPALQCVGRASPKGNRLLSTLLTAGFVPVISSIGADSHGQLLNVNADQAAVVVAQALSAQMLLLSDVPGVLDGQKQLIAELDQAAIHQLIADGVVKDGMQVKVEAALDTANLLEQEVIIAGWRDIQALHALLDGEQVGTRIVPTRF